MEYQSQIAVLDSDLQLEPYQSADSRRQQSVIFLSVRQYFDQRFTNDWQSSLAYAYTDARITSATSTTIVAGNRVQLVPYNQFSWWNKYQINPLWGVALGVICFGDSYAASDDTVRLPGFVRFDTALYLKINDTWQFNVENLFNRGYWASATATTTSRRARRELSASARSPSSRAMDQMLALGSDCLHIFRCDRSSERISLTPISNP
jgi:outer membrane receptor for ferric coprogen and ferric-rhodotorulic acid